MGVGVDVVRVWGHVCVHIWVYTWRVMKFNCGISGIASTTCPATGRRCCIHRTCLNTANPVTASMECITSSTRPNDLKLIRLKSLKLYAQKYI